MRGGGGIATSPCIPPPRLLRGEGRRWAAPSAGFTGIAFTGGAYFAAASSGAVYATTDGGSTWNPGPGLPGLSYLTIHNWDRAIRCLDELQLNAYATKIVIDRPPAEWEIPAAKK